MYKYEYVPILHIGISAKLQSEILTLNTDQIKSVVAEKNYLLINLFFSHFRKSLNLEKLYFIEIGYNIIY